MADPPVSHHRESPLRSKQGYSGGWLYFLGSLSWAVGWLAFDGGRESALILAGGLLILADAALYLVRRRRKRRAAAAQAGAGGTRG
jgi:LPXTG-motif cell wall-anchored protein